MPLEVILVIIAIVVIAGVFIGRRFMKGNSIDNAYLEKVKTSMRYGSLSDFPNMMTTTEAAYYMRIPEGELLKLIEDKTLPTIKIAGKVRVERSAVDQYLRDTHAV